MEEGKWGVASRRFFRAVRIKNHFSGQSGGLSLTGFLRDFHGEMSWGVLGVNRASKFRENLALLGRSSWTKVPSMRQSFRSGQEVKEDSANDHGDYWQGVMRGMWEEIEAD